MTKAALIRWSANGGSGICPRKNIFPIEAGLPMIREMSFKWIASLILATVVVSPWAEGAADARHDEFRQLFNGNDLSGWKQVNCASSTFTVRDGMIVCTGIPTGVLRTDRQYENFILELNYLHVRPKGNAGLFVWSEPMPVVGEPFTRAIEIQILDGRNSETYTSHGDVFAIQGASFIPDRPHPRGWMRCLPSERRARPAGQWNHYRVTCRDGAVTLAVNGKAVSGGSESSLRKGYICLESEGSEVHFKDIRIKELPTSNPKPEQIATVAEEGFTPLYNGVNFRGWRYDDGHKGHWRPRDWKIAYDGKSEAVDKNLSTSREYGDFTLICDWRWAGPAKETLRPIIFPNGDYALDSRGRRKELPVDDAGDSGIYLRGSAKCQVNMWCWPVGSGEVYGYRTDLNQPPEVRAGVTPRKRADNPIGEWNRFRITLIGDRLTVLLNNEIVIENARLPGMPERGRIALQHHGAKIEFGNLLIKEIR
jgi:hypothetical protein